MALEPSRKADKSADVPPVEQLEPRVSCPICREQIVKGAKICINCKSDLSWKRYLAISNTSLALLTALVAVVGSVAPQLYKLLTPDDSRFSLGAIVPDSYASRVPAFDPTFKVLVSNDGPRPGVVVNSVLELPFITDEKTQRVENLLLLLEVVGGSVYVAERASAEITFKLSSKGDAPQAWPERYFMKVAKNQFEFPKPSGKTATVLLTYCRMKLTVISARGKETELPLDFHCERLKGIVTVANAHVLAHTLPAVRAQD